jgi:flagellar biosynthetic protein FliQ
MTAQTALGLSQQALWIAVKIAGPVIAAGLVVGVIVSVFQAATQIQEQTLLFVPKVLALLGALALLGGWMMTHLVEFARHLFMALPDLAR